LLTHAALAVAVETVLPQVRDPEYGYRELRAIEQQRAHPDRPLVLVLGTSRTQNAIDPSSMTFPDEPGAPLVVNAAVSGSWPVHIRLQLRRMRAAGVKPAALLVELFPPSLGDRSRLDPMFVASAARLTAADLHMLEPYLTDPAPVRREWALSRVNSWHALRFVVVSNIAPQWQPWHRTDFHRLALDAYGFTPYPASIVTPEYRERKRAEVEKTYSHSVRTLTPSALSDRAYRDLIADCRAWGIPLAFFVPPESPIFRSWYGPEARAGLAAYARVLSEELGCPVFDAPTDYSEEDFADGHHMLPVAAHRFSRWLAEQHLKAWLAPVR
jgi:hypothetical protein